MTRILSELLQAEQPHFALQLRELERVGGHKNTDIKLSVEVVQAVKHKIHALGLDKHDTTAEELYHALLERVSADDMRLERALRTRAATYISAEADLTAGMVHALQAEVADSRYFALKSSVVKRQLKKLAPKRVQKGLGYRSLDAMLRAESAAAIVAAAQVLESAAWRRSWTDGYKQLHPTDFEERPLKIVSPSSKKWQTLTEKMVLDRAHTVIGLSELGALILLPLPADRQPGMVVASLALALHEENKMSAESTYLRASQVHGDFATRVQAVAKGSVTLESPVSQQAMPWQLVQQYFSRAKDKINEDVFGPYVHAADFDWHNVEAKLAEICPSMAFWEGTSHLSFLENGKRVSLNVVDAAINRCNALSYEVRSTQEAERALWHELTLRYLNHESLERAVASVLQPKLATENATN